MNQLKKVNTKIVKKAIRNKVFQGGTIDGYHVVAIDGTKVFGSKVKHSEKCLTTKVKDKPYYFHSGSVMSTIGNGAKIVMGLEMYQPGTDSSKKSEGELNVSKRLLKEAVQE